MLAASMLQIDHLCRKWQVRDKATRAPGHGCSELLFLSAWLIHSLFPRIMPLVLFPFTSRDYKLVNNVFLLQCEQKEEPAMSKLCKQIFYFFPFYK